jgi:hypothetical protein
LRWPDWPPYRGGIDLAALARVLEAVRLDDAALHWLGSRELEQACRKAGLQHMGRQTLGASAV